MKSNYFTQALSLNKRLFGASFLRLIWILQVVFAVSFVGVMSIATYFDSDNGLTINLLWIAAAVAAGISWLGFLWFMHRKGQSLIVIAFYLVFLISILAESLASRVIFVASVVSYSSLAITLAVVSAFLYQVMRLSVLRSASLVAVVVSIILALLAYMVPVIFIAYVINFDISLTKDALYAVFQSNLNESIEFVDDFFGLKAIGFIVFVVVFISCFFWYHRKSSIKLVEKRVFAVMLLCSSFFLLLSAEGFRNYKLPFESFEAYKEELNTLREMQERIKLNPDLIDATKELTGELYVVVLGESLNKHHMSLYGYHRKTTPNLDAMYKAGELIKLNRAFANHTHTVQVLSKALTNASQLNGIDYSDAVSIINLFQAAQFETIWLTNQNLLGAWDNHVSVIAHQSDSLTGLNASGGKVLSTQSYDDALLPYFAKAIKKPLTGNRVVFVHLAGSHAPYHKKFPSEFAHFRGKISMGEFGIFSQNEVLSERLTDYDNSIFYNDYIVSNIINQLKSLDGVSSSLVYMADHADDVIANRGHNADLFTYDMIEIPTVFWVAEEYKNRNPQIIENLTKHQDSLFSNDFFYDTLVGWAGISTPHFNPARDLTSSAYDLPIDKAVVLHGKRTLADKDNYRYWQAVNAKHLLTAKLDEKIFPHRVNSSGKLQDIWNDGFRSFEADIIFDYKNDGLFYLGHHDGVMGDDLETFLSRFDHASIKKAWFDLKNLDEDNAKRALDELERLDQKFNLKAKIILESGWTSAAFSTFSGNGWRTSYYLPTDDLLAAQGKKLVSDPNLPDDGSGADSVVTDDSFVANGNAATSVEREQIIAASLRLLADDIAARVGKQQVSAVSFDDRLYPFVKVYLEGLLPQELVYHVWYGPKLASTNFSEQLSSEEIYQDERIKTFLCTYKSNFDL